MYIYILFVFSRGSAAKARHENRALHDVSAGGQRNAEGICRMNNKRLRCGSIGNRTLEYLVALSGGGSVKVTGPPVVRLGCKRAA